MAWTGSEVCKFQRLLLSLVLTDGTLTLVIKPSWTQLPGATFREGVSGAVQVSNMAETSPLPSQLTASYYLKRWTSLLLTALLCGVSAVTSDLSWRVQHTTVRLATHLSNASHELGFHNNIVIISFAKCCLLGCTDKIVGGSFHSISCRLEREQDTHDIISKRAQVWQEQT